MPAKELQTAIDKVTKAPAGTDAKVRLRTLEVVRHLLTSSRVAGDETAQEFTIQAGGFL